MTRQRGSTPAERRAGPKSRLPPAGPRAALEQLRDMAAALLPACVRVSPALPSPPGGHRGLWGGSRGPSRRLPYSPAGAEKGRRRAGPEGSPAAPPAPALPEGRATSCGPGAWRGHRRLRQGPREEARPAAVVSPPAVRRDTPTLTLTLTLPLLEALPSQKVKLVLWWKWFTQPGQPYLCCWLVK